MVTERRGYMGYNTLGGKTPELPARIGKRMDGVGGVGGRRRRRSVQDGSRLQAKRGSGGQ